MSFNGSGLFVINSSGQPVVAGTDIDPTVFNALTADLATGLSNCITKDGQTTVTANIPMATYKFTGLGAGSARTDSASLANVQDGTGVYVGTVGGTADVITLTPSPAITSYTAGQTFRFIASGANTTNVTVNVNGLGAKAITKNGTTALAAGDIPSGMMVEITYDGTRFILGTLGATTYLPLSGGTLTGALTISSGVLTISSGGATITGRAYTTTITSAFSATPTLDTSAGNYFEIGTLTGNITSLTLSNPVGGHTITIRVKQDGTGNRTVASPSGAKISGSVALVASQASHLTLTYSTADSRWEGYWSSVPV